MFDPFQSSPITSSRTANNESKQDLTFYYSTSSDSDSSGAEHRSNRSSTSGVGKYKPPHRKSVSASNSSDSRVRLASDTSSSYTLESPTDDTRTAAARDAQSPASLPARPDDGGSTTPPAVLAPSSPSTSASSSTVTASEKQCYVYVRTGHCAKGALCRYKHETSTPPTNTVKHFDPKSHPSYRTKPCYPFIYGQCLKGDECTFKHEIPSSQVLAVISPVTSEPPPPSGASSAAPPEYRTKECKWFSSPGGCWYGDSCKFKHTVQLATPVAPAAKEPQQPQAPVGAPANAPTFIADSDLESQQSSQHPYYRTRPCPLFLKGACQKGDLCNYIHPAFPSPAALTPSSLGTSPRGPAPLQSSILQPSYGNPNDLPSSVSFVSPFAPRHALSIPTPTVSSTPRAAHHSYSLPVYPTNMNLNGSFELPSTPTTTNTSPSASISASPTSSLVASPPHSFFHRSNEYDYIDEATDAIGGGARFGPIGSGMPYLTKELIHEVYTYDDDEYDDEVIVYQPSRVISPVSH